MRFFFGLACFGLLVVAVPRAGADEVVLKNGNTLHGVIEELTGERVVLDQPGGRIVIPRAEASEIRRKGTAEYFPDRIKALAEAGDLDMNQLGNAAAEKIRSVVISLEPPGKEPPKGEVPKNLVQADGTHFIAYAPSEDMARRAVEAAEFFYPRIQRFFYGDRPAKAWAIKCKIYIHPTKEIYMRRTGRPPWAPGVTRCRVSNGRLVSHAIHTFSDAADLFSGVLPHEMGHALFWEFLEYPSKYPLWLHEGVAVSQEKRIRRLGLIERVYTGLRAGTLPRFGDIAHATRYPKERDVQVFYGLSYAAVDFLIARGGSGKFLAFTRDLRSEDIEKSLKKRFGMDVETFEKSLLAQVKKVGERLEATSPAGKFQKARP